MKRMTYILKILAFPVMAPCQDKMLHIILIMTDQHRADALVCMGNDAMITPHIDELAPEGVNFVNGYTSVPSCTPAKAGLLKVYRHGTTACWDMAGWHAS